MQSVNQTVQLLAGGIAGLSCICAVGRTDGALAEPQPGETDVDLFALGSGIPPEEKRRAVYEAVPGCAVAQMTVCQGGVWGTGDRLIIGGVDVMPMYFTLEETYAFLDSVLSGERAAAEGLFYPVGRLCTFTRMLALNDARGVLRDIKRYLSVYPEALRQSVLRLNQPRLWDDEDFSRAVRRRDILYYHQVLENALDGAMQTLFALNRAYMPSRKRGAEELARFAHKPDDCANRMLEAVRLSACEETIAQSAALWRALAKDIRALANNLE